jgi:hypothetical protein
MRNHTLRTLALAVEISLAGAALSASARAGALGQGAEVTGSLPGQVLWTYYQTLDDVEYFNSGTVQDITIDTPDDVCSINVTSTTDFASASIKCRADNIIRLINPNGAANGNLAGAKPQPVCAMIYVFDDDQEMGECCGCPLTSAQLATFSVDKNLTSNWGLAGGEAGNNTNGAIALVAAAPNGAGGTCIPTNLPGYSVTTASNLLGGATQRQFNTISPDGSAVIKSISGGTQNWVSVNGTSVNLLVQSPEITEIPLSDDAGGDPNNLNYLQEQCGAIVGNGTGGGICNCPTEG